MLKSTFLAAAALVALSGGAYASTVDVVLGNTSNSIASYGTGGTVSGNITLTPGPSFALSNNAGVASAGTDISGVAVSPSGTLFGGNYAYVTGDSGSAATFTLSASQNSFGLTWGTIDNYNTLTLTDSLGHTYAITGTDILNNLAGSVLGTTQADVTVVDPFANIVSAVLTSSANSFEAANFTQSAVPLPASVVLFSMALVGLVLVGRRRDQNFL